jgi:sigma-E factor negative regulatory protein RseC
MKDQAVVQRVEGENITLICGAGEGCRSCQANSLCAAKTREVSAVNPHGVGVARGDTVEFYIHPGKTIFAGFVVLILPLLTFILGFILAGNLFPLSGEGFRALVGLAGLAGGFGVSLVYNRLTKKTNVPIVTRRIEVCRDPEPAGRLKGAG